MTAKSRYDNLSSDRSQFLTEAEDGIRYCLLSRGLGDVYKRQTLASQRFDEAKRLVTPGGVTAGSLIRGSIPNFGGARGSTTQPTSLRGTGTTGTTGVTDPTGTTTAPVYETVPSTYTAPTQTGTDNSALEDIQRESYIANLARLGITDLRNMPQFRTQKRTPKRFRSFRRGYF